MKLKYLLIILVVFLLGAGGYAYWYFSMGPASQPDILSGGSTDATGGFVPFDRSNSSGSNVQGSGGGNAGTSTGDSSTSTNTSSQSPTPVAKAPSLRLISGAPVGGFAASTTVTKNALGDTSITLVRWIDRGRGNVFEAQSNTVDTVTLSNTIFPRIYESWWNKNLTAFVAQYLPADSSIIQTVSAGILKRPAPTAGTSTPADPNYTPYQLKGNTWNKLPITMATSPKKDRVFYMTREADNGVGYISGFDGQNPVKLFETPLTQVTADWPEENTIVITTNASASYDGFVYFVNPKTGAWKRIVGPLPGLSAKVSHDARYVAISVAGNDNNLLTSIYDVKNNTGTDAVVRTLADKCAWGNFYKDLLYCAVPAQLPPAIYPDDWHKGTIALSDKIWQINASTGEVHLLSPIVDQSDRLIDGYKLDLDANDNYLFFMNKTDLSLWSLDLVSSH